MDSLPLSDLTTTPSRTEAKSNSNGSDESSRLTRKALLEKTRRETRLHYIREFKQILLRTGAHQGSKLEEVNVLELTLKYIHHLEHELESARKGSVAQGVHLAQNNSSTSSPTYSPTTSSTMAVSSVFSMASPMMMPMFSSPTEVAAYQMYLNNMMTFARLQGVEFSEGSPTSSSANSNRSSPNSGTLSSTSCQSSPESTTSSKSFTIASLNLGNEGEDMEEEEIDVITTA